MGPTTGVSLPTGTVTFLFTDIEGSTRVLRTAIAGHGGATTGITAAVAPGGAM
ncbi:MAG: hypothetical protein ABJA81_00760 [Nocardioidaceae bacterium]